MISEVLQELRQRAAETYETATPMPAGYYTSADFFRHEREAMLQDAWHCVGRVEEIAAEGSYRVVDLLGRSLIVTRCDAGEPIVMSNTCRHRGMQLADGPGNSRQLVCPYHGWTYRRSGELISAPFMDLADPRLCDVTLEQFAAATWQGFIFVNLAPEPPALDEGLSGLLPLLQNYDIGNMRVVYRCERVWPVNWKLVVENFMEGYHLSRVHRKTIHEYTPTRLCEHFPPGLQYCGYFARFPDDAVRPGATSPALKPQERNTSVMFQLFPSHVAGVAGHVMSYLRVNPLAHDRTQVTAHLAAYGDSQDKDGTSEESSAAIELFERTMSEDEAQLNRLQRGLKSDPGNFAALAPAPFEGTVLDNYHYAARTLTS